MISKELYKTLKGELKKSYPCVASSIVLSKGHEAGSQWTGKEWKEIAVALDGVGYKNFMATFALLLLEEYDYEQAQIEKIARKNSKIHAIIPLHQPLH